MKKTSFALVLLFLLLAASLVLFSACGDSPADDPKDPSHGQNEEPGEEPGWKEEPEDPSLLNITGVTLADDTVTYDGQPHSLAVSGELPTGAEVSYKGNNVTDAGTYTVSAKITAEGYNSLVLSATLTIDKATVTGVTLADDTVTYDGQPHSLAISGDLPSGAEVSYKGNNVTDAGSYTATASVAGKNYHTLSLSATLTVEKATITGVSLPAEIEADYSGELSLPAYKGTLPKGVSVKYLLNGQSSTGVKALGTYAFTLEFSGKNYNTLSLSTSYKIKFDLTVATRMAKGVIEAFGSVPDPWSFFPASFTPSSYLIKNVPTYTDFTNVSSIPQNGMGKQMHMVYGVLTKMETALGYVSKVYAVTNTVESLYTQFLMKNPDGKVFEGTAGAFSFRLSLEDGQYLLSASVSGVSVDIFASTADSAYGARIGFKDNTVLKYTCGEDELRVALLVADSAATDVQIVRDKDDNVTGTVREYLTVGGHDIVNSGCMFVVQQDYTVFIGTKGDFMPGSKNSRNCEIYRNSDGRLVGSEVREEVSEEVYNTLWYPLAFLSGVNTIKKEDKQNGLNADTIYINGAKDTIHCELFGPLLSLSVKSKSRAYDIEFKKMYFFTYNSETGEYTATDAEIPMLFIQEEKLSDFATSFSKKNEDSLSGNVTLTAPAALTNLIKTAYDVTLPAYDKIATAVTLDNIKNYVKK